MIFQSQSAFSVQLRRGSARSPSVASDRSEWSRFVSRGLLKVMKSFDHVMTSLPGSGSILISFYPSALATPSGRRYDVFILSVPAQTFTLRSTDKMSEVKGHRV